MLIGALTLPTALSLLRIALTVVVIACLFVPGEIPKLLALAGFLVAGMTDWLDGFLARRWHQESALGALLDPIADKVLVLGSFFAFAALDLVPVWMVVVILAREALITVVRLAAASRQIVLGVERAGKQKTLAQMVTIGLILLVRATGVPDSWGPLILVCLWIAMLLTISSGVSFLWHNRQVLRSGI